MKHFATGTLILSLLLPGTVVLAELKAPGDQAKQSSQPDINQLLKTYNTCYSAAVEEENKKAEPQLDDLKSRVCLEEYQQVNAAIPPGIREKMLQLQVGTEEKPE